MTSAIIWTELKLLWREPLILVVSLLFPVLLMVLLLVSFEGDTDPVFRGIGGTEFYVTSYLAAAIAAMGFMGTPTHLAAYRHTGVLRRFQAAGVAGTSLMLAQAAVTAMLATVGAVVMLALAYAGFDLAAPASAAGVALGFAAGIVAFAALGSFLGAVMPSPRAAQGFGLLLFFGTFFLVGGGPPPGALPDALNTVAGYTPTGMLVEAIRAPWTGGGDIAAVASLAGIAVAAALATRWSLARTR